MPSCEVVVIGGGPNGLACAARLARGGAAVTVLEAEGAPGGGARTAEFAPGHRVSALAHLLHPLDPRLAEAMAPADHGLDTGPPLATVVLGPAPLRLEADGRVEGLEPDEAARWDELRARLARYAAALAPLRRTTPPRPVRGAALWPLARAGLSLRRMGRADFREFLRLALINVADAVEDDLRDERLRALLAFDATLGAWLGPRSPGSLMLHLNRLAMGPAALPRGGMGAVAAALARGAEAAGARVRTGARVAAVDVSGDRAAGVRLASGEALRADAVVSAICPRATLEGLVGPRHLDTGTLRQVRGIRARGAAAKLHLALTGAPDFGADLAARLVIAPSVEAVEAAWNSVKYGEVPERPVMEAVCLTAHDPALAPPGHHVLSCVVQFAPHDPPDRDAARDAMLEAALRVLEEHAPGLRALIAHAEILMPYDIAARFGLAGGSWHHGDLAVEQMLFLRPFHGAAQYETPLPGLWLAGAGSHPGGGVTGTAGWNAAERMLAEGAA